MHPDIAKPSFNPDSYSNSALTLTRLTPTNSNPYIPNPVETLTLTRNNLTLTMPLTLTTRKVTVGTLGAGGFGRVNLVRHKDNRVFALKMISKANIIENGQETHIQVLCHTSVNLLLITKCEFVLSLLHS